MKQILPISSVLTGALFFHIDDDGDDEDDDDDMIMMGMMTMIMMPPEGLLRTWSAPHKGCWLDALVLYDGCELDPGSQWFADWKLFILMKVCTWTRSAMKFASWTFDIHKHPMRARTGFLVLSPHSARPQINSIVIEYGSYKFI